MARSPGLEKNCPLFLPILILIGLLVKGFDITGAGFYSSMAIILLFFAVDFSPATFKSKVGTLGRALSSGGKAMVEIVATLVCVNMLVSLLSATGVALKLTGVIANIGEVNSILAFLMAAVIPIILGMGITPAAVYIIAASICASALIQLGPDILQTHMFLFYYSCLAPITPPVCLACYVAANIAEAPWVRVAFTAVKLGAVGFLIPFFFVTNPALLLRAAPMEILHACITAFIGITFMAAGFFGYLTRPLNYFTRGMYMVGGFYFSSWDNNGLNRPGNDCAGVLISNFAPSPQRCGCHLGSSEGSEMKGRAAAGDGNDTTVRLR